MPDPFPTSYLTVSNWKGTIKFSCRLERHEVFRKPFLIEISSYVIFSFPHDKSRSTTLFHITNGQCVWSQTTITSKDHATAFTLWAIILSTTNMPTIFHVIHLPTVICRAREWSIAPAIYGAMHRRRKTLQGFLPRRIRISFRIGRRFLFFLFD